MPALPQGTRVPGLPQSDVAEATTPDVRTALAAGDATTWAEVVARYQGLISSRARRHRLSPDQAADVSQQTWMRLFEHAGDVRDPERLAGWLATTANHECIAARKRSWREEARPDTCLEGTYEPDWNDRLDAQSRAKALRAAVAELPVRERQLIEVLLEPQPLTYAQISSRLHMPIGSIGPIRARALRRLRDHLRALEPSQSAPNRAPVKQKKRASR